MSLPLSLRPLGRGVVSSSLPLILGDRNRHGSGDRSRHGSGDRSRDGSGDRSRHGSGDRSRDGSGDRSRHGSGDCGRIRPSSQFSTVSATCNSGRSNRACSLDTVGLVPYSAVPYEWNLVMYRLPHEKKITGLPQI